MDKKKVLGWIIIEFWNEKGDQVITPNSATLKKYLFNKFRHQLTTEINENVYFLRMECAFPHIVEVLPLSKVINKFKLSAKVLETGKDYNDNLFFQYIVKPAIIKVVDKQIFPQDWGKLIMRVQIKNEK